MNSNHRSLKRLIQLLAAPCLALLLGTTAFAQDQGSGGDCPDINTMTTETVREATEVGESCAKGITFTFKGVTYTPRDSKCPSSVTETPPRELPDPGSQLEGFKACPNTPVDVTKIHYKCTGIFGGCGVLGLQGCCVEDDKRPPVVVNTMSTFLLTPCEVPCSLDGGGDPLP